MGLKYLKFVMDFWTRLRHYSLNHRSPAYGLLTTYGPRTKPTKLKKYILYYVIILI